MSTITVKANSSIATIAEHKVITQSNIPTVIKAIDKTNYELYDIAANRAPSNVSTKRVDKDIHISFEDDSQNPDLIIEGFYEGIDAALVGVAADGSYYYYVSETGGVADDITELQAGETQVHSLGGAAQVSPWWVGATESQSNSEGSNSVMPWIVGLGGIGVLGAGLSKSDDNNNERAPVDTIAPDSPTSIVLGNNDTFITDTEIDTDGTVAVVIGLPDTALAGDSLSVNGSAQVLTAADTARGSITVSVPAPAEGDSLEITATLTDSAGNDSDALTKAVGTVDTIAPDSPTSIVLGNNDTFITDTEIDTDGTVAVVIGLPDTALAGDSLSVNGSAQVLTAADTARGSITVSVPAPAEGDSLEITATLTDSAGNDSDALTKAVGTVDTIAPDSPTSIVLGNNDTFITDTEIDTDGTVAVVIGLPDTALAGDSLSVNGSAQVLTAADTARGSITVSVPAPAEGDSLEITATLTDSAGNDSDALTKAVGTVDTIAPDSPTSIVLGNNDAFITDTEIDTDGTVAVVIGLPDTALAGDTLSVNGSAQVLTAADTARGSITVSVPAPAEGDSLEITATLTDSAGNDSDALTKAVGTVDTIAPDSPTSIVLGNNDTFITDTEIDTDGTVAVVIGLPDTALAGDTLSVNGSAQVLTAADTARGSITVSVPAPAEGDSLEITATLTDSAGNDSDALTKAVGTVDTIAPDSPTSIVLGNNDTFITDTEIDTDGTVAVVIGLPDTALAGDTLSVNGSAQVLTAADTARGSITVSVPAPAEGDSLEITATLTDSAGNDSDALTKAVGTVDTIAPDSPTSIVLGNNDTFITDTEIDTDGTVAVVIGLPDTALAGDTLSVNGSAQVLTAADTARGSITVSVPAPAEGDSLEITATLTDSAGNDSDALTKAVGTVDTIAPDSPTSIVLGNNDAFITDTEIDTDGTVAVVIGLPDTALAGDTLSVNGSAQVLTAADTARGSITVSVPAPAEGDSLEITATLTDSAGNDSDALTKAVGTVDTVISLTMTTPIAGDNVVNDTEANSGFDITGTGTANDIITLTDTAGSQIGTSTVGNDGNWNMMINAEDVATIGEGMNTLTATATDAAGNNATVTADIMVDTTPPATPPAPVVTDNVANDGGVLDTPQTVQEGETTNDSTPSLTIPAGTLNDGETVQLVIDGVVVTADVVLDETGGAILTPTTALDDADYALSYNVVDSVGNVSANALITTIIIDTATQAQDDSDTLDLGELQVTTSEPITASDLVVLGVAESNDGANSSLSFTVSEGSSGIVSIEVNQIALVAVADAVNVEIYNDDGVLVYVGTTGDEPLVGDVIGLDILGLTDNDTLTATASGLVAGDYTIVVRNDRSALESLVDDLTLAELGDAGVVLGADNQDVVLDAVETALNGGPLDLLRLGTLVRTVLEPILDVTTELGVGQIVDTLNQSTVLSLTGRLDDVLDAVADALLSNTLTLLETTDVTATVTEYDFLDDTTITGNVINPDASMMGELGEDTVTLNARITDIADSSDTDSTSTVIDGMRVFTIEGEYGVLTLGANGDYTYVANGDYASSGRSEVFTYTVSDGITSDTAELVIDIDSTIEMGAGDDIVNITDNMAQTSLSNVGTGDDLINIDSTLNVNIKGGEGLDTINLAVSDYTLSLSDIFETEVIDISGTGANVLNVTETDIINSGTESSIYVQGDSDDTVNLQGDAWMSNGQVTNEGQTYDVWQIANNAQSQIYIDTEIANII